MLYLMTFGCMGIGAIIDMFRLPMLVREHNKAIKEGRLLIERAGCKLPPSAPYACGGKTISQVTTTTGITTVPMGTAQGMMGAEAIHHQGKYN